MKRFIKNIKNIILLLLGLFIISSCNDFLDQNPDSIFTDEDIFSDDKMITSVLANYYGQVDNWGEGIAENTDWQLVYTDDACLSNGGRDFTYNFDGNNGDFWRVYDYKLIRNINQFLNGINTETASKLEDGFKKQVEGEARFLRAWTYFNMCRSLGGMPIVGDTIFKYDAGMDVSLLQIGRSTEAEMYDYIIKECDEIALLLPEEKSLNAARANKWAALALKARAAIYAASLSKYNNLMTTPIKTSGGEVGIPADRAQGYYQTALSAAKEIIDGGVYSLYNNNSDKSVNFYEAIASKDNNNEVIWARDYVFPGDSHNFTQHNMPRSVREDVGGTEITPILNFVEAFEYINERNGELKIYDEEGNYIFYDNPEDIFADKDPRLGGTVIFNGAKYRNTEIIFQAGQKYREDGEWKSLTGSVGSYDNDGDIITSEDGPINNTEVHVNKSGFCIRKFIDETTGSGTLGQGSEVWFPYFRYAEILLIASEASMELGEQVNALTYINEVRDRAGIQDLSLVTLDDIVRECRVEFAYENHRFWDMKRWRLAHRIWTGNSNDYSATHYALFPYRIKDASSEYNGKWVYEKQIAYMTVYPRFFQLKNYYNFLDNEWLDNNPRLIKNPYQ